MRAKLLTLYQPWATLIAIGAKRIETRPYWTGWGGWLLIHAGKAWGPELADLAYSEPFRKVLDRAGLAVKVGGAPLPFGAVVAAAELGGCIPTDRIAVEPGYDGPPTYERRCPHARLLISPAEAAFGNYEPGRWAWLLGEVRPLAEPLPCRGMQGLRDADPAIAAEALWRAGVAP